jgi:hypothetical protein
MKNKNIAKFGIPILLLVSISECGMVVSSTAEVDNDPTVQTLEFPIKAMGILDMIVMQQQFKRLDAEIIEVSPWLNPDKKNNKLSDYELVDLLKKAGFYGDGLRMAWAIVQEESTSRIYAHNRNRNTGDNSYGLFQINMIDGIGSSRLTKYDLDRNEDLFIPAINARVAFEISDGGKNWNAWTTYKKAKSRVYDFPS